jgi:hypothetical protein
MRISLAGLMAVAGTALIVTPAFAQTALQTPKKAIIGSIDNFGSEVVPNVEPGEQIMIACAPIEHRDANADVRVVLTIAAAPTDAPAGYKRVLATDEELGKYGVRVRVPGLPNLPDHTVNLDVYVMNGDTHRSCDAGHVRVVQKDRAHPLPDFRHEGKDHVS